MNLRRIGWLAQLIGVALAAQEPSAGGPRAVLQGVVFDSVAARPLANALVQVATNGSTVAPRTAFTDALGRYRVTDLEAGQYTVGFYHDALTALGLDAPTRGVTIASEPMVTADLFIPSARTVRAVRCGEADFETSSGMLVGTIRDAEQRNAMPGAVLRLSWPAFAFDAGNYRTVMERATATIEPDGSVLACRLPVDAVLEVEALAPGHRSLTGTSIRIPPDGIGRVELALTDTARVHGTAVLRGQVTRPNGKAVASGRAVIAALGREAPIQDGRFVFGDLPVGSWVVEARVIGTDPLRVLAQATESDATPAQFVVSDQSQKLDAVTVVGKKDPTSRLLDEVLQRKRLGFGTTFLPGSPTLKSASQVSDVMRDARGFRVRGRGQVDGRSLTPNITGRTDCQDNAVYVDDVLQSGGFADADMIVFPSEVLAIETWPDIRLAPVQYRIAKTVNAPTMGRSRPRTYCAVVLIWTKNRPRG